MVLPAALLALSIVVQPPAERPIALVDDTAVYWSTLRTALTETAGAAVLADFVLDQRLARLASAQQVSVTDADIAHERSALVESVRTRSALTEDQSAELLNSLRRGRGLGPERYDALLRRNALMRRLVQPDVLMNDAVLQQAFVIRHGPKVAARVIVAATAAEAAAIRAQLLAEAGDNPVSVSSFGDAAARFSLDESGSRGGVLEPFSPEDPGVSPAVRSAAKKLTAGALSEPVPIETGFALLMVTGHTPADATTFDEARPALERDVRRRQERRLMDALARRLIEEPGVTVMDRSLGWSWRARTGG